MAYFVEQGEKIETFIPPIKRLRIWLPAFLADQERLSPKERLEALKRDLGAKVYRDPTYVLQAAQLLWAMTFRRELLGWFYVPQSHQLDHLKVDYVAINLHRLPATLQITGSPGSGEDHRGKILDYYIDCPVDPNALVPVVELARRKNVPVKAKEGCCRLLRAVAISSAEWQRFNKVERI